MYRSPTSTHIARIALVLLLSVTFAVAAASPAMAQSAKKTRAVIRIIKAQAVKKHLSQAEISAMLKICRRESSFIPTERTGSCKGLFQLQTHYSRAKWANPAWNTRKAIRYVRHRYGTWRAALRHSYRHGWY